MRRRKPSVWGEIAKAGFDMGEDAINFPESFRKVVGNGDKTKFWREKWVGDRSLEDSFPRLASLETNVEVNLANRGDWINGEWVWRWCWRREPRGREIGELEDFLRLLVGKEPVRGKKDEWEWVHDRNFGFTVNKLRDLLENSVVRNDGRDGREVPAIKTLWSDIVPRKVNVFMWRLRLNRLPTRSLLNDRGIDLGTSLCPRCGECNEDLEYAVFQCAEVKELWTKLGIWWNKNLRDIESLSQLLTEDQEAVNSKDTRGWWVGLKWIILYLLWNDRNKMVFKGTRRSLGDLFFEWQKIAYDWASRRIKTRNVDWSEWIAGPSSRCGS